MALNTKLFTRAITYKSVYGTALCLTERPFSQGDWPLPRRPVHDGQRGYEWTTISLALVAAAGFPFGQHDWPNPRGAEGLPVGFVSLRRDIPSIESLPINQFNWPNPHAPRGIFAGISSLASDATEAAAEERPHGLQDWPVPKGRRQNVVGFVHPSLTFATFVNTPPISTRFWGLPPRGKVRLNEGFTQKAATFASFVNLKPTAQYDWPVPKGKKRHQDWIKPRQITLGIVQLKPHAQEDWPNPRRKRAEGGFTQRANTTLVPNVAPVGRQRDWPNPRGKKGVVADWVKGYPRTFATFVNTPPVSTRSWTLPPTRKELPGGYGFTWSTWANFIPPAAPAVPLAKLARTNPTTPRTRTRTTTRRTKTTVTDP